MSRIRRYTSSEKLRWLSFPIQLFPQSLILHFYLHLVSLPVIHSLAPWTTQISTSMLLDSAFSCLKSIQHIHFCLSTFILGILMWMNTKTLITILRHWSLLKLETQRHLYYQQFWQVPVRLESHRKSKYDFYLLNVHILANIFFLSWHFTFIYLF